MSKKQVKSEAAKATLEMYLHHRVNCNAVINELVDQGLAYCDDETKPHWTPEGKKCWQNFYRDLATMHESW